MFQAAIAWQVFQISGSTLQLGLIGLTRFLPQLLLTPIVGAVADTYDRRKIILLAQIVPLACSIAILSLTVSHAITVPWIFFLVFWIAVASSFDQPARQSLLPQLVPAEIFPRAVTVAAAIGQLAFVVGPMLGGLLIAKFTVSGPYMVYAVLITVSAASLFRVRARYGTRGRRGVTIEAIREGLVFLRRNQVALGAMTLDMFALIFGGATALLPVYATKILHVGAGGYGILASSLGIGALLMSVLLMVLPPFKRTGLVLISTVAVFGLMTMLFGISRVFWFSLVAYALTGAGGDDDRRGRNAREIRPTRRLGVAEQGSVRLPVGQVDPREIQRDARPPDRGVPGDRALDEDPEVREPDRLQIDRSHVLTVLHGHEHPARGVLHVSGRARAERVVADRRGHYDGPVDAGR